MSLSFRFLARVARRQLAAHRTLAAMIAVVTMIASAALSATPLVVAEASLEDLRARIGSATPEQRNLSFEMEARIFAWASIDPLRFVGAQADEFFEDEIPQPVRELIDSQSFVIDSPKFAVSSFPDQDLIGSEFMRSINPVTGPFPTSFQFRVQQGIEDQVSLVDGEMPVFRPSIRMLIGPDCPDDPLAVNEFREAQRVRQAELAEDADDVVLRCFIKPVPVIEVLVTAATAADMQLGLGQSAILTPDGSDLRWHNASPKALDTRIIIMISGIIELTSSSDEFWYGDNALHRARVTETADFRLALGMGLIPPPHYGRQLGAIPQIHNRYEFRYFINPARITASSTGPLSIALAKIDPRDADVSTHLPKLIDEHLAMRRSTIAMLAAATSGLIISALTTLLALSILLADRTRTASGLMVDRGASRVQVTASALGRAGAIIVPASISGGAIAWVLFANSGSAAADATTFAIAVLATTLVVAAVLGTAQSTQPTRSRHSLYSVTSLRRLMFEAAVFIVAVASTVILRRSDGVSERITPEGVEPLLVVAPATIMLAAGFFAIHVHRGLASAFARVASRGRGAVGFIGLQRVTNRPFSLSLPIVVILVAVATAVFGWTTQASIASGQAEASWSQVGADYRIEAGLVGSPLPQPLGVARLQQVGPVASGIKINDVIATTEIGSGLADVFAIEASAYQAVLADSAIDLSPLELLTAQTVEGSATAVAPLPAVLLKGWLGAVDLTPGERFQLNINGRSTAFVVSAVIEEFPGLDGDERFVIVDLPSLAPLELPSLGRPTVMFVAGPQQASDTIDDVLAPHAAVTRVESRHAVIQSRSDAPFTSWTSRLLRVIAALAAAAAIFGSMAGPTLSATRRSRDLAVLESMGLTARQRIAVTLVEHGPALAIATALGVATGIGTRLMLNDTLRLDGFTGGVSHQGSSIDLRTAFAVGAILLLAMTVAVSYAAVAGQRRQNYARILREGDE